LEDGAEVLGASSFGSLELTGSYETEEPHERRRLVLSGTLPIGYHRLSVSASRNVAALIVTPGKCWLPPAMVAGRRFWGVAAQLYLLRSNHNWGIGDFTDLDRLTNIMIGAGANVIGVNPLHALFLDDPEHASPYSPACRLLLNVLNIDVACLPELPQCEAAKTLIESPAFMAALARCRAAERVAYSDIARLKLPVLRLLFASSRSDQGSSRWAEFVTFRRECGTAVTRACLFLALREYFAAASGRADWHEWPIDYRDPDSDAVRRFAREHADRVIFHEWLQFVADAQLAAVATAAESMVVGLYRDLAVGADPSGAETWGNQNAVVAGAHVGAPPDIYNLSGQDWGLPPFSPRALREEAYRSFIELVRANMRHAGGLRIDHVMALQQLYWVPAGRPPTEGAYVSYPLDDLVGILALESHRNRCLVVGEDLGTVPDGFRERMAEANILSYRVLFFERDQTGFLAPAEYPALALAVTGSHDLPTLVGWWEGRDIALKEKLALFPDADSVHQARRQRVQERAELLAALRTAKLIDTDAEPNVEALILAVHAYLARTRCTLVVAQMDDVTGEAEPVNVPATSEEHPNWRRRLSLSLEQFSVHPRFLALTDLLGAERR
jgi:4-alpha-glucanotransferase